MSRLRIGEAGELFDPAGRLVGWLDRNGREQVFRIGSTFSVEEPPFHAVGVPANGTATDQHAGIQAALNDKAALPNGGEVYLPESTFGLSRTLYVPNKVRLVGGGESSCLQALPGFVGARMVELGALTDTFAFGAGLQNLRLYAFAIAALTPVYSSKLQENSGLSKVWIDGHMNVPAVDLRTVAENCTLEEVYMVPHPTSTGGRGIYLESVPWISIRRCSFDSPTAARSTGAAIELNDSHALVQDFHAEKCNQGLLSYNNSALEVNTVHGVNVANLVEIALGSRLRHTLRNLINGRDCDTMVNNGLTGDTLAGGASANTGNVLLYEVGDKHHVGGSLRMRELAADAAAPAANSGVLYMRDNGAGKTQLCVRFATGAIQVLATEP
ncbi:MAG: Pectate lyase superfamily protein [Pseudomonadota bacterium]|jgi:hypothetical protein